MKFNVVMAFSHFVPFDCSTLQDGFELPSRLSVSAADCILSITEALTQKTKVPSIKPKSSNSNASDQPLTVLPAAIAEKKVKPSCKSSEVLNIEKAFLLWNQIEELITLLQRLLAVCSLFVLLVDLLCGSSLCHVLMSCIDY